MLNIFDNVVSDGSIVHREVHAYNPLNQRYNRCDEIIIPINHHDVFTLPCESYIFLSGKFTPKDPTKPLVSVPKGAILSLFEGMRFTLNNVEIDRARNVFITSQMKNTVSCSKSEWEDIIEIVSSDKKNFHAIIPLKNIMGYFEDYKSIVMGVKQELIILRSKSDTRSYVARGEVDVELERVEFRMPHVHVSDEAKLRIMKKLEKQRMIQMPFRRWDLYELPGFRGTKRETWCVRSYAYSEKPRYIIVGLQDARDGNEDDATLFDHKHLVNIKVHMNSKIVPYNDFNLDIENGNYVEVFHMLRNFCKSYYGLERPLDMTMADMLKKMLFVFDVSKQDETFKNGVFDLKIQFEASRDLSEETNAFCLVINDAVVEYEPLSGYVRNQ